MNKIYLIRHGQDEDNAKGLLNGHRNKALTEIGFRQVEEVSKKIKEADLRFDKIYHSPLLRTSQTAQKITGDLKISESEELNLIIERDFGVMAGKPIKNMEALCAPNILKTENGTYFLSAEGAETFPQVIFRAKETLKFIQDSHHNQSILLVTHGDFGKMLYAVYYDIDWKQALTFFSFGNSELILLAEGLSLKETHIFNTFQYNL